MVNCKKCASGVPHQFKHGPSGYTNHACRCDYCTEQHREKNRAYVAKYGRCRKCYEGVAHQFAHGVTGYDKHNCRCGICVEAHNAKNREWHARKSCDPEYLSRRRQYAEEYRKSASNSSKLQRKYSRLSHNFGSRARTPFSPAEDSIVMDASLSAIECAAIIGRSAGAVYARRHILRRNNQE